MSRGSDRRRQELAVRLAVAPPAPSLCPFRVQGPDANSDAPVLEGRILGVGSRVSRDPRGRGGALLVVLVTSSSFALLRRLRKAQHEVGQRLALNQREKKSFYVDCRNCGINPRKKERERRQKLRRVVRRPSAAEEEVVRRARTALCAISKWTNFFFSFPRCSAFNDVVFCDWLYDGKFSGASFPSAAELLSSLRQS